MYPLRGYHTTHRESMHILPRTRGGENLMRKQEYIRQLWENQKRWAKDIAEAYSINNLLPHTIDECSNPIQKAAKNAVTRILQAEEYRQQDGQEYMETEDEIIIYNGVKQACKLLKFGVHGDKARPYHCNDGRRYWEKGETSMFMAQFMHCLWNDHPSIFVDSYYKNTLLFIRAGCNVVTPL